MTEPRPATLQLLIELEQKTPQILKASNQAAGRE